MLKYRIVINSGFLLARWHESNPNQFYYITRSGHATFIDFDFVYNFCDDIVLSISGCKLLISMLSRNNFFCEQVKEESDTVRRFSVDL